MYAAPTPPRNSAHVPSCAVGWGAGCAGSGGINGAGYGREGESCEGVAAWGTKGPRAAGSNVQEAEDQVVDMEVWHRDARGGGGAAVCNAPFANGPRARAVELRRQAVGLGEESQEILLRNDAQGAGSSRGACRRSCALVGGLRPAARPPALPFIYSHNNGVQIKPTVTLAAESQDDLEAWMTVFLCAAVPMDWPGEWCLLPPPLPPPSLNGGPRRRS